MKKMNLLAMSLVSAAALSFSSCSSNDDLAGGGTQSQADGVYMTLKISGATSHGTRTSVATPNTTEDGTVDESTITEGTMYIYDENTHSLSEIEDDDEYDEVEEVFNTFMNDENIQDALK